MNLVIVLVAAAVVAVALGAYLLIAARRRRTVAVTTAYDDEADGVVSEPVPIERADERVGDLEREFGPVEPLSAGGPEDVPPVTQSAPEPVASGESVATSDPVATAEPAASAPTEPAVPAEMCWAKRFAPRDGALDDSTRLGLIRDLGLVRAPWGVPLLVQAYDEEPDAAHRRAVLAALALYRHIEARAVFERALRSDDENERAIAGAALADLGVTPSLSP